MGLEWLAPGPLPDIAGTYTGECIVVCTAMCLWDDLAALGPRDADILCVNDAGLRFPGTIEHWYSSHAEIMTAYRASRGGQKYWGDIDYGPAYTHTMAASRKSGEADCVWPWPGHGNSGLNAIYTALGLGYERVFVAGQPMDNSGHYYDGSPGHWLEGRTPRRRWTWYGDRKNFRVWERAIENVFDGRVTFLSGRFA